MNKRIQQNNLTQQKKESKLNSRIIEQAYQEVKKALENEGLKKRSSKNPVRRYYI